MFQLLPHLSGHQIRLLCCVMTAEYPHGVFPLSQLIAVSLTDGWPGHKIYSLAADSVFHVPLWKHVMTW